MTKSILCREERPDLSGSGAQIKDGHRWQGKIEWDGGRKSEREREPVQIISSLLIRDSLGRMGVNIIYISKTKCTISDKKSGRMLSLRLNWNANPFYFLFK